jgi:signal transduction histidine kinase
MQIVPGEKFLRRFGIFGMLLPAVVIPVAGSGMLRLLLPDWQLVHVQLHTLVEALGSFSALLLATLLFLLRQHEEEMIRRIWLGCGLLVIGIFGGLYAAVATGPADIWLRSAATLAGGFLFCLAWLPERLACSRPADQLPLAAGLAATLFGLFVVAFPALLPAPLNPQGYIPLVKALNAVGGALFLLAAVHLALRYRTGRAFDDLLFAGLSLLFGMAALLFWFARVWHADYWFWQLVRLAASLYILNYLFRLYLQTVRALKGGKETLERRVLQRTEQLSREIAEHGQAEEEVNQANEELRTLNRVVTTCASFFDLGVILNRVLGETMRIVNFEEGSICLRGPDGNLHMAAHRGSTETVMAKAIPHGQGAEGCCYRTCSARMKPIILPDREAVLRFEGEQPTHLADIRFHAAFPLVTARERCVGILCVFTCSDTKPPERSLRLVETITTQVALLIENARLFEETLRHTADLERKVAERTAELEEANRKLLEIDRLKSMFIASMSHELRTPLNSVIGFSSILLKEWLGPLNEEQKENLATVLRAGKLLLALINDVIDVSKIEAGLIDIHLEEFDLFDVMTEAVAALEVEAREKGLDLRAHSFHLQMYTDRRRLLQCLLNLLVNAVRYTEKGWISLSGALSGGEAPAAAAGSRVEIVVEDSGIGIREEDAAKLFEPFVRLESPLRSKVAGTGLGLYLTRKLARDVLGGDIFFTSEFGRGSRFALTLPVSVPAALRGAGNEDPDR